MPQQLDALTIDGRSLELLDIPGAGVPLLLLHEGLGSVRMWRTFPADLAAATGRRVIAFSRYGHGDSDAPPRPRTPSFMHEEARAVLPAVLAQLGLDEVVLVGHSDGASIALIYAAEHPVNGVVVLAPHVFVERKCVDAIRIVKADYQANGLRERLARHHKDVDGVFWAWNNVWLDPDFRAWDLRPLLGTITAPVLLMQGTNDQYGTMQQLDDIQAAVRGPVTRVELECMHSPALEAPDAVIAAIVAFLG